MAPDLRKDAVVARSAARPASPSAGRRRPWWRRPWIAPLGVLILAFLAFSLPRYLGLDPQQSLVPSTFPGHYALLVAHIGFATIAMTTGFFQVWPWFRRRFRTVHRRLGRVYVLGGVIPSSILAGIIGSASPFGPMTAVSHVFLAVLWLSCTVAGFRAARQRRFDDHREWMVRSYVLTTSIITNRLWHLVWMPVLGPRVDTWFQGSELAMLQTEMALTNWLGWTVPLVVAEALLMRRRPRHHRSRAGRLVGTGL
ncbi:DUF2306 domain-containing protein [Promicromonospora soli]|uniref:DUF2306 domain-containing protein n=1 Tax=Promicromonospora soli TaxID=2035533 RepID=UPI00167A8A66|nr:DUF2306 domain-containing protein [Promicromonospora soli]